MSAHRYRRTGVSQADLRESVEAGLVVGHCSSLTEVLVTIADDALLPDLSDCMGQVGYAYVASGDYIISEEDGTTTSGAVTSTGCEAEIPDGFFGILSVDVTGEHDGTPADAYGMQNTYLVSGEGGAATVRAANPVPLVLDPNGKGVSAAVDANGQNVRVRVTGIAAEDWTWSAHIGGLLHER